MVLVEVVLSQEVTCPEHPDRIADCDIYFGSMTRKQADELTRQGEDAVFQALARGESGMDLKYSCTLPSCVWQRIGVLRNDDFYWIGLSSDGEHAL